MATLKSVCLMLVKAFIAAALGLAASYGAGILNLGASAWKGIAAAGIAAVVAAAYTWVTAQHPKTVWAHLLLIFAGTALAQVVVFGAHVFDVGAGQWRGVLGAAVAAVMLAAYNYLSPKQTEYGVGVPNAIAGVSNYTVNLTK